MTASIANAPMPVVDVNSSLNRRLIGLEIELDANTAPFHKPVVPTGWEETPDGSLRNGKEYILVPPQVLTNALDRIKVFSDSVTAAKMHVSARGGYHIHVQVADYSLHNATMLARLYHHYQECIDLLCGKSRRSTPTPNQYAMPFNAIPTADSLANSFRLHEQAEDRPHAKNTRVKAVVNFAMMRCINAQHRTVEFRQPSPSKHTPNIWGWACFAAALTEFATLPRSMRFLRVNPTWRNFKRLCLIMEQTCLISNLCDWVDWRRKYLQELPSEPSLNKLYRALMNKPRGIFYVAQLLNINVAVAKRLVELEVHKKHLVEVGTGKYRSVYNSCAELDAQSIITCWEARERPAVALAVPRVSHGA